MNSYMDGIEITKLEALARRTRDDWKLVVTVEISGFATKAAACYVAGAVTGDILRTGVAVPRCGVSHNFDQPEEVLK